MTTRTDSRISRLAAALALAALSAGCSVNFSSHATFVETKWVPQDDPQAKCCFSQKDSGFWGGAPNAFFHICTLGLVPSYHSNVTRQCLEVDGNGDRMMWIERESGFSSFWPTGLIPVCGDARRRWTEYFGELDQKTAILKDEYPEIYAASLASLPRFTVAAGSTISNAVEQLNVIAARNMIYKVDFEVEPKKSADGADAWPEVAPFSQRWIKALDVVLRLCESCGYRYAVRDGKIVLSPL